MSSSKLSSLTELTSVASGDFLPINDVSDLTDGSNGTSKKITKANLVTGLTLSNISDVTASAAEVNIMDGVTATTAEINKLAGLSTTAAELGYVSGVTSAIQTQLSGKAASSHTHTASQVTDFSTAADARITAAIGTSVQAYDADLTTWGGKTAPSGTVIGTTDTQTLTNKRITKRVQSVSDAATITPNADSDDCVDITAIAQAFTIANPSGTPTNFQTLVIRIKDNGTARAITWGSGYAAGGVALPSTTVLSKILNLGFMYNTANSLNKWQLIASAREA